MTTNIDITELQNFFTIEFNDPIEDFSFYESGYQTSLLDILYQKAKRAKVVKENKISDYIQVENDPNHDRELIKDKLEVSLSQLSVITQMVSTINSQLIATGIHEYIPTNIKNLLFGFQSFADTNINILNNLSQKITFQQIESTFLNDLRIQYAGGDITYKEIARISDSILNNMIEQPTIKNNSIRNLLSLNLQSLLPNSMSSIFDDLQYLLVVNDVFSTNNRDAFNNSMKRKINLLKNKKVSNIVVNDYSNEEFTYDDALGLTLRNTFKDDVTLQYNNELENAVDSTLSELSLVISEQEKQDIIDVLVEDSTANVTSALTKTSVGLPSLSKSIKAINTLSHNNTIQAVLAALEKFTNEIILENNIVPPPSGTRSIDYLLNVKRNIEARINQKSRGVSQTTLSSLDEYLNSVLILENETDIVNTKILHSINDNLDKILKE